MNYWQLQAERNAAIDRGVSVCVPGVEGWTFFVRPKHAWNYHFSRACVRLAASSVDIIEYLQRSAAVDYIPTAEDQELNADMERRAFAEGCLASWQGVTDEAGNDLPFSPANARRVLETFPQIFACLNEFSQKIENYKAISDEAKRELAAGNSKAGCATASDRGESISEHSQSATRGEKARRKK